MEINHQTVKQAIYKLGGATAVGHKLRVSTNTVHIWMKNNRIPKLDKAEQVAAETGFALASLNQNFRSVI